MNDTDRIMDEAIVWHARTVSDSMNWEAFTKWLESNPRHRDTYEEIALTDAILDDHAQGLNTKAGSQAAALPIAKAAQGGA